MAGAEPDGEPRDDRLVVTPAFGGTGLLRRIEKTRWATLPGIGIGLAIPPLAGFGNLSYLPVAGVIGLMAGLFALAEDREIRSVFLGLWALSLSLTLAVLLLVSGAAHAVGGPFLGPDSTKFLKGSLLLAREHFHLPMHPTLVFLTNDVGHYYLYGLLIWAFHADVFAIQLFNCGLTAMAGALTFSAARFIVPRFALVAALVVALNPELMMLAATDLLKDPSIVLALTALVWALVRVWQSGRAWGRWTNAAFAFLMATYLRIDRFYVEIYLAAAVAAVVLLVAVRGRPRVPAGAAVAVAALAVFVATEIATVASGWGTATWMMYDRIAHVRRTAKMRDYAPGLVGERSETENATRVAAPWAGGIANAIRRLYGPFVWIVPDRWDVAEILKANYLLYPGVLIWYAVIPLAVVGLGQTLWRTVQGREDSLPLMVLGMFTVLYFTQYLTVNLSYRQRASMVPVAVVFGFVGLAAALKIRTWKRWYAGYWAALGVMAVVHLAVRSLAPR